jgi:hypothetical protein
VIFTVAAAAAGGGRLRFMLSGGLGVCITTGNRVSGKRNFL